MTGFEPAASCYRSKRSTKLSYTPPNGRFRDREIAQHSGNPVQDDLQGPPAPAGCKKPAEMGNFAITKSFHDAFEAHFPSTCLWSPPGDSV